MYQSLVVEANFIYHLFVKDGIVGKGKDPIHGIASSIYKIKPKEPESENKYRMQVYEKISKDLFDCKVQQLQKSMTIYTNPHTTRIILIAKEQLHQNEFDLYVLYEYNEVEDTNLPSNLEEQKAKELLSFFCHNFVLQGRFTYEFLDISPQNVFKKDDKYVVTNFALNYSGTKFHRRYNPTTDPPLKEKKINPNNVAYQYAFKAALITLCCMTGIDPKDFFFDDGQFKEQLLENLLFLIDERPDPKSFKKKFISNINQFFMEALVHTRDEDEKAQRRARKDEEFKYVKTESILNRKYSFEFLDILRKLLNVNNIQSRSIFLLLITEGDNILKMIYPYFEIMEDKNNFIAGTGQKEEKLLNGCGRYLKNDLQLCGQFENGEAVQSFTEECKTNDGSIRYILYGLQSKQKWYYEQNKFLQIPKQETEDHEPLGDQTLVVPINLQYKSKRETIYCYEGEVKKGRVIQGKSYQNDQSVFKGEFDEQSQPKLGKMVYQNNETFDGQMEGFNKKKGVLKRKNYTFEGDFHNDQMSKGVINYNDGGIFIGSFVNGEQSGYGIYKYPNCNIQYVGKFENGKRHGPGRFQDKSQENCVQNVVYIDGKCTTPLDQHFLKALQQSKLQKQNTEIDSDDD